MIINHEKHTLGSQENREENSKMHGSEEDSVNFARTEEKELVNIGTNQ